MTLKEKQEQIQGAKEAKRGKREIPFIGQASRSIPVNLPLGLRG